MTFTPPRDANGRPLHRFHVYRTRTSPRRLCICAARDKAHALRIARGIWQLDRTAYATPESLRR